MNCVILSPLSMESNFWEIVLITLNDMPDARRSGLLLGGRVCKDESGLARRKLNRVVRTFHNMNVVARRVFSPTKQSPTFREIASGEEQERLRNDFWKKEI